MKCPECKFETNFNTCPNCGMDVSVSRKSMLISNRFYNSGLARAQAGDLSGAVEDLNKSLGFNKRNISARNLLGLVYGAYGRLGDALRQWVISYNYKMDNNKAGVYIESIKRNYRSLEKQNESVKLYNKALYSLSQDSDDMAVIQLKRAIDISPDFIDALNLLALCNINSKQYGRAGIIIKHVLEIDAYNKTALKYQEEVGFEQARGGQGLRTMLQESPSVPTRREDTAEKVVSRYAGSVRPSFSLRSSHVVFMVAGALFIFLIYNMFVLPPRIDEKDAEVQNIKNEMQITIDEKNAEIEMLYEQLSGLRDEKSELDRQLKLLNDELALQQRVQRLNYAKSLLTDEKYEEAVIYIDTIDLDGIPEEFAAIADEIRDTSYPKLEDSNYRLGINEYNMQNYDAAKEAFLKSVTYTVPSSGTIDNAYYYLGRIAEINKEYGEARGYYEKVIEDYPQSNQYYNARSRIANLPG